MIKNSVSIEELRINLSDLVGRVMYGKDRIMIKKYNRDAAILLSIEDYEKLLDPTKRLSKSEWNETVEKLESIHTNIPGSDPKTIESDINQAIQKVRADNR